MTFVHVDRNFCTTTELKHSAAVALGAAKHTELKAHINITEFALLTTNRAVREGSEEVYATAVQAHLLAIEHYNKVLAPREEPRTIDEINERAIVKLRWKYYSIALDAHKRAATICQYLLDRL